MDFEAEMICKIFYIFKVIIFFHIFANWMRGDKNFFQPNWIFFIGVPFFINSLGLLNFQFLLHFDEKGLRNFLQHK